MRLELTEKQAKELLECVSNQLKIKNSSELVKVEDSLKKLLNKPAINLKTPSFKLGDEVKFFININGERKQLIGTVLNGPDQYDFFTVLSSDGDTYEYVLEKDIIGKN